MRLISLNLWGGRAYDNLLSFLQKEKINTEIFCFQEVLDSRSGEVSDEEKESKAKYAAVNLEEVSDLYTRLEGMLEGFDSSLSESYSSGIERLAIFTKRELHAEIRSLPVHRPVTVNFYGKPVWTRCIMQRIHIESEGNDYDIAQVHGLWQGGDKGDTPERIEQSHAIKKRLLGFGERRILCGDFNLLPNTESIQILEDSMRNLIKDYGISTTRSSLAHKGKGKFADYMFVSNRVHVKGFEVPKVEVSDHLPLCLDFE